MARHSSPGAAIARAARYLESSQRSTGCINDVVDPITVLTPPPGQPVALSDGFKALSGADVWHTIQAAAVLADLERRNRRAERFVANSMLDDGLCYWSLRRGVCIETMAAAALLLGGSRRARLRAELRRRALPDGRWASYIVDEPGGYARYLTAPSVSAWACLALGDPRTTRQVEAHLQASLEGRDIWRAHPAFYATPFYPGHVAARVAPRPSVAQYVLDTQAPSGAWGYGDPPGQPSVIPTALAVLTLAACGPRGTRERFGRARAWLVAQQRSSGAFPAAPTPAEVWYAGDVYATALAVRALRPAR